jgi:hypothetical protein
MLLNHYSASPVKELRKVKQEHTDSLNGHKLKPQGFWLSVGTSWLEYAKERGWISPSFFVSLWALDLGSILVLDTRDKVRDIRMKTKHRPDWGFYDGLGFQGVLFDPYLEGRDYWYEAVSIPSAVVWDPTCLRRVA